MELANEKFEEKYPEIVEWTDAEVYLIRQFSRGETLPLHLLTGRPGLGPVRFR